MMNCLTNISLKLGKGLSNLKEFTLFYFIQILYHLIYSYILSVLVGVIRYIIFIKIYEERLVMRLQIFCLVFTFPYTYTEKAVYSLPERTKKAAFFLLKLFGSYTEGW